MSNLTLKARNDQYLWAHAHAGSLILRKSQMDLLTHDIGLYLRMVCIIKTSILWKHSLCFDNK